jgi:hypothetical protein
LHKHRLHCNWSCDISSRSSHLLCVYNKFSYVLFWLWSTSYYSISICRRIRYTCTCYGFITGRNLLTSWMCCCLLKKHSVFTMQLASYCLLHDIALKIDRLGCLLSCCFFFSPFDPCFTVIKKKGICSTGFNFVVGLKAECLGQYLDLRGMKREETTWCNIPEGCYLHTHHYQNLKSHKHAQWMRYTHETN